MGRRKLTKRQTERIKSRRAQAFHDASGQDLADAYAGRVLANFGAQAEIESEAGLPIVCKIRQHVETLVPGDKVYWRPVDETGQGVVEALAERTSILSRPNHKGEPLPVAANVTQLLIVIAPVPAPGQTTIDRYLVAAELGNIEAKILINKCDLIDTAESDNKVTQLHDQYAALGYETFKISVKSEFGLAEMSQLLQQQISVVVGQSGVGKSSILNALLPEIAVRTADQSHQHGRHTTTTARLYHLPNNVGDVIDSPGIREFPLWPMPVAQLVTGFREFAPLLEHCKYRNCRHVNEPGCGLLAAAATDPLLSNRVKSYQAILESFDR